MLVRWNVCYLNLSKEHMLRMCCSQRVECSTCHKTFACVIYTSKLLWLMTFFWGIVSLLFIIFKLTFWVIVWLHSRCIIISWACPVVGEYKYLGVVQVHFSVPEYTSARDEARLKANTAINQVLVIDKTSKMRNKIALAKCQCLSGVT